MRSPTRSKKYIKLPKVEVAAMAAEALADPEKVVSSLLSVLLARKVWAQFEAEKSSLDVAVFSYTAKVPTPKEAKQRRRR